MARRLKTVEITIKYQIFEDEKKILDKYGYDYETNASNIGKSHAKYVAAELKKCEKERLKKQ